MRATSWIVLAIAPCLSAAPVAARGTVVTDAFTQEPATQDTPSRDTPAQTAPLRDERPPIEAIPLPPSAAQGGDAEPADPAPVEEGEEPVFGTELEEAMGEIGDDWPDFTTLFGDAFAPQPLTAEQEARLPLAGRVVDRIFPQGTYARMMDTTLKPMMDGLLKAQLSAPRDEVASLTGVSPDALATLDDAAVEDALAILDPQYAERADRVGATLIEMTGKLMSAIEPAYRSGLTRAYARRFDEAEMAEMLAFFETPAGSHYAAESMLIAADPEVMAAMNEMGPAMMEVMPQMVLSLGQIAQEFPRARHFGELSEAERSRLSGLLGVGEAELEALQPDPADEGDDGGTFEDGGYFES